MAAERFEATPFAAQFTTSTSSSSADTSSTFAIATNVSITEEREIERIMDGLVDFGDDPRLLELYKTLCRHVYYKYPALVGEHTALFQLQFEETEDGDTDTEEVKT